MLGYGNLRVNTPTIVFVSKYGKRALGVDLAMVRVSCLALQEADQGRCLIICEGVDPSRDIFGVRMEPHSVVLDFCTQRFC